MTRASVRGRGHAWRVIREAAIAEHVRRFGMFCPGVGRPGHMAEELTVDHDRPIALGGLSTRANLGAVLCRGCNARKGASMVRDQLTLEYALRQLPELEVPE